MSFPSAVAVAEPRNAEVPAASGAAKSPFAFPMRAARRFPVAYEDSKYPIENAVFFIVAATPADPLAV